MFDKESLERMQAADICQAPLSSVREEIPKPDMLEHRAPPI